MWAGNGLDEGCHMKVVRPILGPIKSCLGMILSIFLGSAIPIVRRAAGVADGNDDDLIIPNHVGDVMSLEADEIFPAHFVSTDSVRLWSSLNGSKCRS